MARLWGSTARPQGDLLLAVFVGFALATYPCGAVGKESGPAQTKASDDGETKTGDPVETEAANGAETSEEPESIQWVVDREKGRIERHVRLDFLGNIAFFDRFDPNGNHGGAGIWFSYPIVPQGLIPGVNDALAIEGGAFFQYHAWNAAFTTSGCNATWYRVSPMAGMRWAFHLTAGWSVYAVAKLGYGAGFGMAYRCSSAGLVRPPRPPLDDVQGEVGLGTYYTLLDQIALRIQLSNFGLALGFSVPF